MTIFFMKCIEMAMRIYILSTLAFLMVGVLPAGAVLIVDSSDPSFHSLVVQEVDHMKKGDRGVACQILIERVEGSTVTTTIRPLTKDESTWHPNDRKGTRSHVMPLDTKVRGAERQQPTSAILYLHPRRIDPKYSLFRLGTFVHELVLAMDLNGGTYSGDYKIREKRAVFFRNAWCDALGFNLIDLSDRVPTPEYQEAKKLGLLSKEYSANFPILDPAAIAAKNQH